MDSAVVKVKLPAGDRFVAAIVEAAVKYAARRDLPASGETTFVAMVEHAAQAINSSGPATISFTATESSTAVTAELLGTNAAGPLAADAAKAIEKLGPSCASCAVDTSAASVRFSLPLG